jgi:ribonuclease HI
MKQLHLFNTVSANSESDAQPVHHFTLFIDGASRNNPGPSAAGIYLLKDGEEMGKYGYYLGIKTNNQAEYLALILGLFIVREYKNSADTLRIISDSQLLVRQILGEYKIKHEGLKPLHALARTMVHECNAHIAHVLRADNTQADAMANQGLDTQNPIPQPFIDLLRHHAISI